MNAKTRRKLEMGANALAFSQAHPDPSPGYAAALARLEDRLVRGEQLASQQLGGIIGVHSAAARKRDLLRTMRRAHLAHLNRVARVAERDLPELRQKFMLRRGTIPYLTFRTAARGMADEAESLKEELVKHGLADTILQSLAQALAEFDDVVEQGIQSRRAHVGASAELDVVADDVVRIVRSMDGLNRFRFAHAPELLASWQSASNVVATPRSTAVKPAPEGTLPAAGDVIPAA
jgi:hypothetical protein